MPSSSRSSSSSSSESSSSSSSSSSPSGPGNAEADSDESEDLGNNAAMMADIDTGEGSNSDCEGVDGFGDLKAVTPERPGSKPFDLFQPIIRAELASLLIECCLPVLLPPFWCMFGN